MKKLGILLVLFACPGLLGYTDEPFRPFDHDKILHMTVATVSTFAISEAAQKLGASEFGGIAAGAGATMLLAMGKEFLHDEQPSRGDFIADVIGIGLGAGLSVAVEF